MKRITLFISIALVLLVPLMILAGNLDSPADLGLSGSAMYTLLDIFNLLDSGTEATKSDAFDEPDSGPGSTGKSLDDVYELIDTNYLAKNHARVPKTGQTTSYRTGDDGDLEKGVNWPTTRFTNHGNGTVTDNLTGLMWIQNPDATTRNWNTAVDYCAGLTTASYTDWRLPNRFELESLLDLSQYDPCLPSGHPFTGVQSIYCWSSSTYALSTGLAWYVDLDYGRVYNLSKADNRYVWPVRGGQ